MSLDGPGPRSTCAPPVLSRVDAARTDPVQGHVIDLGQFLISEPHYSIPLLCAIEVVELLRVSPGLKDVLFTFGHLIADETPSPVLLHFAFRTQVVTESRYWGFVLRCALMYCVRNIYKISLMSGTYVKGPMPSS